jgi:hypothetical protein
MTYEPTLDCQRCGDVVRELSPAEAQQVARHPYDFIVFCARCKREVEREMRREAARG